MDGIYDTTYHGLCKWHKHVVFKVGILAGLEQTHPHYKQFIEWFPQSIDHLIAAMNERLGMDLDGKAEKHDLEHNLKHTKNIQKVVNAILNMKADAIEAPAAGGGKKKKAAPKKK